MGFKHQIMSKIIAVCLLTILSCLEVSAQSVWELKKDVDGIQVFTANSPNSNFKSIKVECTVKAKAMQLVAFLTVSFIKKDFLLGSP